jgi:serine phosphatase RsbU (regulator of sigma subunit)
MAVAPNHRMTVLLIEDDEDDALIVDDLLSASATDVRLLHGYTLQRGIELLSSNTVDCVLLDLRLPDAEGLEAVTRVREVSPEIAVVVLTGFDEATAGEAAVEAGAQDYLSKANVDPDLLSRAIRYAVGRRHAEETQQQLRLAEVRAEENRRLERGLVPHPIVADSSVWIASRYLPGRRRALLGGDFYDVVETADGVLHAMIGDVAGRGPDEAALGASLRIAWRALTLSGARGDSVLPTLERMIEHERQVEGLFATMCTVEIGPERRTFSVRRAGHPPPVVIADGSVESLPIDHGGPPIGMLDGGQWPQSEFELPASWSIMLFTDGAIEGRDGADGHLGEEGLRALIAEHIERAGDWQREPHDMLHHLIAGISELNGEELSDDLAMLLVGSRPA